MATILVVEDDRVNQALTTKFLQRHGYGVLQAMDGLTGVALAQSNTPDLILMDLNLPDVNGWEVTRRIKASPQTAGIPIIALTANHSNDDVNKAARSGCCDFDTKPLAYSRLLTKINLALAERRQIARRPGLGTVAS